MYRPSATEGPIPKANKRVPTPKVPPKYQPTEATVISMKVLTAVMGNLVFLWRPVIKPSLGPGPRLAIKYKPLPNPTNSIPQSNISNLDI